MLASLQLKSTLVILDLPNNHLGNLGAKALAQLSHLERLDLTANNITATGTASIAKITTLQHLNLSSNAIKDEGCGHLSSLSSLTSLNISRSEITSVGLHCLVSLTAELQELVIDDNWIYKDNNAVLDDLSSMTCLNFLSWSYYGPRLASFISIQQLSSLTQLQKLHLGNHYLFAEGDDPVLAGLAALSRLTSLLLEDVVLDEGPHDELECLSNLTSLLELRFCFNGDGDMLEPLTRHSGLTKLEVWYDTGCLIRADAAAHLAPLTNIRHLALPCLDLSDGAAAAQITSLRQNLTFLDISACGSYKDTDASAAAVHWVGNLSSLVDLNLQGRCITDAMAADITRLTNLTKLQLQDNCLSAVGAEHLASLPSLKHLNISRNHMAATGAAYMASLTSLTFLNISYSHLGDAGTAALATLPNLCALNVESCVLGVGGAAALAQLSKLTYLEASRTRLGPEGVEELSALTKLQYLGVYGCEASYKDVACLAMSLPQLRKLSYFGLSVLGHQADVTAVELLSDIVLDVC